DNVFIERLWRSLKYEDVYLKGYSDGREARAGIGEWIAFYNERRLHQALGYRAPRAMWRQGISAALGQRLSVVHMPTATTAAECYRSMNEEKRTADNSN